MPNVPDPLKAQRESLILAEFHSMARQELRGHVAVQTLLCPLGHGIRIDRASELFESATGHTFTAHCSKGEFFFSG